VTFRWTRERGALALPLRAAETVQGATLAIRYARFIAQPVEVRVFISGRQAAHFRARPGRFRTERLPVTVPEGPLRIEIVTDDPDPQTLGLAVDWVRLERVRWAFAPAFFWLRLLVLGGFVIAGWAGFGMVGRAICGGALAMMAALWAALDPFGLAHVSANLALPALLLTALAAALVHRRPGGKWVTLIFFAGYLLKGAGLFYPSYFYPDVRNHGRYVLALAEARGGLEERGRNTQMQVNTAYPRTVAGKAYAFPYSPVFFIPFTWLPRERAVIEDTLKHVALAAGAAEVLVVYCLSSLVLGPGPGVLGALLAAFLPAMYSRLLLAMWPSVAGHLLDSLTVITVLMLAKEPDRLFRLAMFVASTLGSLLTYVGSLFNLGAFIGCASLASLRLAPRLAAGSAFPVGITLGWLYGGFTATFLREIVPALWAARNANGTGAEAAMGEGLASAFARIPIFYGYGYPALAIAGILVMRRRVPGSVFRIVAAYGLAFLMLVVLRGSSGGLFKDLKEILFVGPLVAFASGASLQALASRGGYGKLGAGLVTLGLILFGLQKYRSYLAAYASLAGL